MCYVSSVSVSVFRTMNSISFFKYRPWCFDAPDKRVIQTKMKK